MRERLVAPQNGEGNMQHIPSAISVDLVAPRLPESRMIPSSKVVMDPPPSDPTIELTRVV